ncbi:ATP-binding protein [Marinicrinis lubricantis]
MERNFGAELDDLKAQLNELQQLVHSFIHAPERQEALSSKSLTIPNRAEQHSEDRDDSVVFFSGQYRGERHHYWREPQVRRSSDLSKMDSDKISRILSALGHKQRLDILKSVGAEPLTGAEIVDRLQMGTTGQLYHHLKALLGADLLVQEERGGKYMIPSHRVLPLMFLFAAASEILDTSDYIELTEARSQAGDFLGDSPEQYDVHLLLQSVLENCIAEHRAGYCSQVTIVLHQDGSITVADNGRGIPVHALSDSKKTRVQAVLTEMRSSLSASVQAPHGTKGISIPVVNALSQSLSVVISREGKIFRQDFKHGIPQNVLMTVGQSEETGTSMTFRPDPNIFSAGFRLVKLEEIIALITESYPELSIQLLHD